MRGFTLLCITAFLFGCAAPVPYAWQDTRQPVRDDVTVDLEQCRAYAARQYRPGVPMGEPFLKEQENKTDNTEGSSLGEWRPDRSPFPTTNSNTLPVHAIPVDYTGYPGELDYYPSYLDDILEKCMQDRGWSYQPVMANE